MKVILFLRGWVGVCTKEREGAGDNQRVGRPSKAVL